MAAADAGRQMLSVHVPPRATAECQESASAYPSSAEYTPHQQGLELASMQKQPRAVPNAHSPSFLNHHHRVLLSNPEASSPAKGLVPSHGSSESDSLIPAGKRTLNGRTSTLSQHSTAADQASKEDTVGGMIYYAVSSVFYALMAVFSKLLENKGYPVWELTLLRALVILTVSLSTILAAGGSPWGVRRGLLFVRGTLGYASLVLFFTACYYLPLATATTFTFFAPIIVALASPWLLHEPVSPALAVVIPVCVGAVVLVTQPPAVFGAAVVPLSAVGVAAGLAQPFFAASVKMVVRELRKTETTEVIILYLVLCTLVYSCIGCLLSWQHLVRPSWQDGLLLLGLGLCGYGNQLCTTKGLERAKAASVMSMQYSSLVFTQIAGVLVFGEVPTAVQAAGMAVIVLSMLGYLWFEARAAKQ